MALKTQKSQVFMEDIYDSPTESPSTFTAIEEVVSISGPDGTASLIDTTHLMSDGKEYLSGIPDFGKLQLECNFTGETKQMDLRAAFMAQAQACNFILVIPEATGSKYHKFAFLAIVNSWALGIPTDSKVTLTVSIQISGGVTYTANSSLPT